PQRRCRKRLGPSTTPNPPKADAPNRAWAVDFHFRATTDGRPVKIVSVVEEHIRTRPLRAFLSALGIAIGIAAMVAGVGISSSSQANFNALLAKLGTNMLTVSPGQTLLGQKAELPEEAIGMIARIGPVESVSGTGAVPDAYIYRNDHIPSGQNNSIAVL